MILTDWPSVTLTLGHPKKNCWGLLEKYHKELQSDMYKCIKYNATKYIEQYSHLLGTGVSEWVGFNVLNNIL